MEKRLGTGTGTGTGTGGASIAQMRGACVHKGLSWGFRLVVCFVAALGAESQNAQCSARTADGYAKTHEEQWSDYISMHKNQNDDATQKAGPAFPLGNPRAPQGGILRFACISGAFSSLNPWDPQTLCAPGLGLYEHLPYDSLAERLENKPFSLRARLAYRWKISSDRSRMTIELHPKARFSNGDSVCARDVIASFKARGLYGSMQNRALWERIQEIRPDSYRTVTLVFRPNADGSFDLELPLRVLLQCIFSHKSLDKEGRFKDPFVPIIGSGPYRIVEVSPGKRIVFDKRPDYWGKDLPVLKGLYNPQKIVYDLFANEVAAFEAFKKGDIDFWEEKDASRWKRAYDCQGMRQGKIQRVEVVLKNPLVGMRAVAMNSDCPLLQDRRVRKALCMVIDSKQLMTGADPFVRCTQSFFQNTEFEAQRRPEGDERALIKQLPSDEASTEWVEDLPCFEKMSQRQRQIYALELLKQAGWILQNNRLIHKETQRPFRCEILVGSSEDAYVALRIARLGRLIGATFDVKTLDPTSYLERVRKHRFDMIFTEWRHSLSPGAEQFVYWGKKNALTSPRNHCAVRSDAVDFLCQRIVNVRERKELITTVRVLDRVLRHGYYALPLWHNPCVRLAYWKNRLGMNEPKAHHSASVERLLFWARP